MFNIDEIRDLTSEDDMEMGMMGERKQAIFAVVPDSDPSLSFLVGMLYTQMIQELYFISDNIHGGRLPHHVRMILDEFANISIPENFQRSLATMRSRGISATVIVQNTAQLMSLYDREGLDIITGNCDTIIYLGGNEQSTHEYISKSLGKETIDTLSVSEPTGGKSGGSKQKGKTGRELLTASEVRMLDNDREVIFVRGMLPVMDRKYEIEKDRGYIHARSLGDYVHREKKKDSFRYLHAVIKDLDIGELELIKDTDPI